MIHGPPAGACTVSCFSLSDFGKVTQPREAKRFRSSHLMRLRTTSKPSANSLSPITTRCVESAWPWLPELRLTRPTVALPIRWKHRGRQSSTQLRASTRSGQRRSGTLGTVWPGVRNAACRSSASQPSRRHADDSGPPEPFSCPGVCLPSCTPSAPDRDSTHPQKLKDGTYRTDPKGYKICREGSCSHDQGSDPSPRLLSHVCIRCLQPHRLVSCPAQQRRKANRATKDKGSGK